jgi:hypothetical protein
MIHGSDFPAWLQRFLSGRAFQRCERIGNILEKEYQLKRAMGYPEEVFTRIWKLMRLPKAMAA